MQYDDVITNPRWRTDAILKIVFWQYLSAILANLCKFRNGDEESQADMGHLTKVAIFATSIWRRAAILKIAVYPYLSRNYPISSKFGVPMRLFDKKKSKFFKFKMADGRHIANRFLAISWLIDTKFGKEMKNNMPIQVTWPKMQFSQIQDCGRPPFWKQFSVFTSFL